MRGVDIFLDYVDSILSYIVSKDARCSSSFVVGDTVDDTQVYYTLTCSSGTPYFRPCVVKGRCLVMFCESISF
jgi:methylphosphotriester-DNA--protein-cysteine methyltransferase